MPPSSPSFWEIGGYKANVRRIRDGALCLDEFSKMVNERMALEEKYGKSLQTWQSKWATQVETTLPAASTIKTAWSQMLEEGAELSRVHLAVKDRLKDEIVKTLTLFRKENYHQSTLRGFREAKDVEDDFEKAQREWRKLFERVDSTKKAYHTACRAEKSSYIQLMNSQADSATVAESTDKTRERHDKCREDTRRAKQSYEMAIREITNYNSVYNENMTFVFEKCQQIELKRLRFFAEMLSGLQDALSDLIRSSKLSTLHDNLAKSLTRIDEAQFEAALAEWSTNFGTARVLECPTFEDYTPEMRSIAASGTMKNAKKEKEDGGGGVVLTRQTTLGAPAAGATSNRQSSHQNAQPHAHRQHHHNHHHHVSQQPPRQQTPPQQQPPQQQPQQQTSSPRQTPIHITTALAVTPVHSLPVPPPPSTPSSQFTPPSIITPAKVAPKSPNTARQNTLLRGPARVLYDYTPSEADEISLSTGEILEVISGPDELGWCYGKKSDCEGLFPYKFVAAA